MAFQAEPEEAEELAEEDLPAGEPPPEEQELAEEDTVELPAGADMAEPSAGESADMAQALVDLVDTGDMGELLVDTAELGKLAQPPITAGMEVSPVMASHRCQWGPMAIWVAAIKPERAAVVR